MALGLAEFGFDTEERRPVDAVDIHQMLQDSALAASEVPGDSFQRASIRNLAQRGEGGVHEPVRHQEHSGEGVGSTFDSHGCPWSA